MVMEYGMSSKLGAIKYGKNEQEMFLARDINAGALYSQEVSAKIDKAVRDIVENAHNEAWNILNTNRKILDTLVTILLKKETILEPEIKKIFKDIKKEKPRNTWLSAEHRTVSKLPPVPTIERK
jgi:cell division protease FtsH